MLSMRGLCRILLFLGIVAGFAGVTSAQADDSSSYVCPGDLEETAADYQCTCAKEAEHDAYINYAAFYYCSMKGNNIGGVGIVILLVALVFYFYLVGTTTDDFLVPTLERLSTFMNLSEPVAGVTLLALGNGAPDVFTSFAAFTGGQDSSLGVGEVIGAGLVITTLVMWACIHAAGEFQTNKLVIRDIFFTLAAVLTVFVAFIDGEVHLYEALLLFGLWLLFVLLVYIYRHSEVDNFSQAMVENTIQRRKGSHAGLGHQPHLLFDEDESESGRRSRTQSGNINSGVPYREIEMPAGEENPPDSSAFGCVKRSFTFLLMCLEAPFQVGRLLTIPMFLAPELEMKSKNPAEADSPLIDADEVNDLMKENKTCLCFSVGLGPVLFAAVAGLSFNVCLTVFILGSIISVILFNSISNMEEIGQGMFHYSKWQQAVFLLVAFTTSIVWVYVLSNELVDALAVIGGIMGISSNLLGLTFLAWGNCVQDLVADYMLAARGQPLMAIGGVYGGPGFNIMVGLGMGFSYACWGNNVVTFEFESTVPVSFIFFIIILLYTIIWFLATKFRASKLFGYTLFAFYVVFLTLAILAETGTMKPWKIQRN